LIKTACPFFAVLFVAVAASRKGKIPSNTAGVEKN